VAVRWGGGASVASCPSTQCWCDRAHNSSSSGAPAQLDALRVQLVDEARSAARVARSVTEAGELGTRCSVTLVGTPCHGSSLRGGGAAGAAGAAAGRAGEAAVAAGSAAWSGRQRSEKASKRWLPKERWRSVTCSSRARTRVRTRDKDEGEDEGEDEDGSCERPEAVGVAKSGGGSQAAGAP